ncbi:lysine N(6)-hydroxylase/L-ornithine N(5)-oxygenase family protein [Heyndrickxia acidicola]|uniref:L-lysine N6-monooxygenase MbtG n=1 Tax=Heyndrickxia acidicola TaxID=209389 RepID=A0ABU6MIZ9_9BACI|nr:SidA/IucD/PvdA family monooxygenase [Heyndrickxia acidicola]MED1204646.1 SidA/IucD/PvdA family monooxygenase [Heyndrickxia acidicola]
MIPEKIYDLIGVGIGPSNLSLAALTDPLEEISALFFEQKTQFDWHPGMMIEGTDMQVSFLADLVTFADPTSNYSYLNYLFKHNRLYHFYFYKHLEIPRKEYQAYSKWVAEQLEQCLFGKKVIELIDHDDCYEAVIEDTQTHATEHYFARNIVLGTGSIPIVPDGFESAPSADIIHSSQYLYYEKELKKSASITVIGSGQSAAETFHNLLLEQDIYKYHLTWFTRSSGFMQLESGKLSEEVFSPEFVDYYHDLPLSERMKILPKLHTLRNGISPETLKSIYDLLYRRSIGGLELKVTIQPLIELVGYEIEAGSYRLQCRHTQEDITFHYPTEKVVLATGYRPNVPAWINPLKEKIVWEDEKRFKVTKDYEVVFKKERPHRLFSLTNLEHVAATGADDLELAVQRNQRIINKISGQEHYPVPSHTVFQQFSIQR